jgi:hypothetical protein
MKKNGKAFQVKIYYGYISNPLVIGCRGLVRHQAGRHAGDGGAFHNEQVM